LLSLETQSSANFPAVVVVVVVVVGPSFLSLTPSGGGSIQTLSLSLPLSFPFCSAGWYFLCRSFSFPRPPENLSTSTSASSSSSSSPSKQLERMTGLHVAPSAANLLQTDRLAMAKLVFSHIAVFQGRWWYLGNSPSFRRLCGRPTYKLAEIPKRRERTRGIRPIFSLFFHLFSLLQQQLAAAQGER
jgi:hypothetical protein